MFMKKFLAFFVVGVLMLPLAAQATTVRERTMADFSSSSMSFTDFKAGHPNFTAVAFLKDRGVINGYPDGSFKPDVGINRAELTKMVVALMGGSPDAATNKECFKDVHEEWFAPYVCYAKAQGWIDGYADGNFKPSQSVNRVEAMKIVLNAMIKKNVLPQLSTVQQGVKMPLDTDEGEWYGSFVHFAIALDLLDLHHVIIDSSGAYNYMPGEWMTRKEVAEMIFRTFLYMAERYETAWLYAEKICALPPYMQDISENDALIAWRDRLTVQGYTEDEFNDLQTKYADDEVVQGFSSDYQKYDCGTKSDTDMQVWNGFEPFVEADLWPWR